jgi:hypothetical protein
MQPRVRPGRWAAAVVLPLVLLAACGNDDPEEPDPTAGTPSETTDATTEPTTEAPEEPTTEPTTELPEEPTTEPTTEPTSDPPEEPTTEPTPEPTDDPTSPATGLASALLTADTLPAPAGISWGPGTVKRGTGAADISVCQRPRVKLSSIGATKGAHVRVRSRSVSARHVVARFPDARSATLGYGVLEAWLGQCEEHGRARGFFTVNAPDGYTSADGGDAAGRALVFYGPVPDDPSAAFIEPQALVRVGDTLSWVVWKQIGQDYNYEEGQSPPELVIPLMVDALTERDR